MMITQDFSGFIKKLEDLQADVDSACKKVVNRAVNEGMARTIKDTPTNKSPYVIGGTLKKGWIQNKTKKSSDSWVGGYSNNVFYGIYVNYGHRKKDKSGKTIGYQPGKFFLESGITYAQGHIDSYFHEELEKIRRKRGL